VEHGLVDIKAEKLVGAGIYMDKVSVGATINIMMAAALAEGQTVIENAAKEPHIVDVANFLNSMGANIKGAGTDVIKIKGVTSLHGGTYAVIPDQIEAGTFMIAAAATGGDVLIKNVIPKHLDSISAKLIEMGVTVEEYDDSVRVKADGPLKRINFTTRPYPGFPTDAQAPLSSLLTLAHGDTLIEERIFENRFMHVPELQRMGAQIKVLTTNSILISGVNSLSGAPVMAADLRGGVALVLAALAAKGETQVSHIYHIDRGYYQLEKKLTNVGAHIERIKIDE